jgi:hypothetical protein
MTPPAIPIRIRFLGRVSVAVSHTLLLSSIALLFCVYLFLLRAVDVR